MTGRRPRRSGTASRWMNLRYAGVCKVCRERIPVGALGFWDSATRSVTCERIDCCEADGLVTHKPLTGPWDTRTDLRVRTEQRVGASAPHVVTAVFNSGAVAYVNGPGRCEDAPCCGCCS